MLREIGCGWYLFNECFFCAGYFKGLIIIGNIFEQKNDDYVMTETIVVSFVPVI